MPLMVGTEQIRHAEAIFGRSQVHVMEPPIDVAFNRVPSDVDVTGFRSRWGLYDDVPNIVCVSRLAHELKLEGILAAMDAVYQLSLARPVRLVIAGNGPAAGEVRARAAEINEVAGRRIVVLTGELADPRPAYACAEVVLGMGGSALRGLSFGKPLVVQGERGFWELLTGETLPLFLWQGWYGSGAGSQGEGSSALATILARLLDDVSLRSFLGLFGRRLVEERFSLAAAARRQTELYELFAGARPGSRFAFLDDIAAVGRYSAHVARRRLHRLQGRLSVEDFNARPVAVDGVPPLQAVGGDA
jgi:glycosyltransferase involved in cell wall biosynthesis